MARRVDRIFEMLQPENGYSIPCTFPNSSSSNGSYLFQHTLEEAQNSSMSTKTVDSKTQSEINNQDISNNLDNTSNKQFIYIINENGELTPMETKSENIASLPELFDISDLTSCNDISVEIDLHETQLFTTTYQANLFNNIPSENNLENTVIPEPINIEVGLRSEVSQFEAVEKSINDSSSSEVNKITESHLREVNLNEENRNGINLTLKRTRKKRHQVKDNDWEYKRAKILRAKGENYKGRRLIDGKSKFVVEKPKRCMKPITCKCKQPTFNCRVLSEDDRKQEFTKFWSMTWQEKKLYVSGLTEIDLTERARDRKIENVSRRKFSFKFYLKINTKKIRVCKQTFLNTFDLKGWTVNNWLKEKSDCENDVNFDSDESRENGIGIDVENRRESSKKRKSKEGPSRQEQLMTKHNSLKEFLLSLPTVESHYCRKSSSKCYLEPVWSSKSAIYELYSKEWCKEKCIEPLSQCTFHKTFEDLNLAIFQPKKDQCDICRAFSLKHVSEEVYQNHIQKKEEAQKEKEKDKAQEDNVFTIDLQSLLLCPKSNASALYYRRKLAVHNLCIFNLRTKEGYCFLWNESEGKLTANEFSSILYDFLERKVTSSNSDSSKKFIIYSDGCTYQNRCATLSNALLHLAVKHELTIEQKFLEKGHTYMECDSMHSVIERYIKNKDINIPADYITICRNARRHPKPYEVRYLDYCFFKDFTKEMKFTSIRPGDKIGDPKVTDIRCLQYSAEGKIHYKLNYHDDYKELEPHSEKRKSTRRLKSKGDTNKDDNNIGSFNFPQLYKHRQKIPREKFNHLQELKLSVPKDFHSYYDNIPTE